LSVKTTLRGAGQNIREKGGGGIKVGSSMDHSFFSEDDLIQQLEQFMADFRLMDLDLQLLTLCVEY
jgi:hypothetical protein